MKSYLSYKEIIILTVILFTTSLSGAGQTDKIINNEVMDEYIKHIEHIDIKMAITSDSDNKMTCWDIILYNNKVNDSILLEHFERKGIYSGEPDIFIGDIRKKIIFGDAVKINRTLYLMLYNYGKIFLYTYEFKEKKEFVKNIYFSGHAVFGSYMNFGDPFFHSEIKVLSENDIFIKYIAGTEVFSGNGSASLLRFDNNQKKMSIIKLQDSIENEFLDSVGRIEEIDLDNEEEKVNDEIVRVLTEVFPHKNNNIYYLGYISGGFGCSHSDNIDDVTYFLFKRSYESEKIEVIQYDSLNKRWLIGNYSENEITE
ncbi:MAG: hypothetical protein ACK5L5_01680 [Bacteroidales bacterium]